MKRDLTPYTGPSRLFLNRMNTTGIAVSPSAPIWTGKLTPLSYDDIGQRENASDYGDPQNYPLPTDAADEGAREIRAGLNED